MSTIGLKKCGFKKDHKAKIRWMKDWAVRNGAELSLNGSVGFARACVGITALEQYPAYEWFDSEGERADQNGEVWTPPGAYHKHPCVAVLGRGEEAESRLYDWLKWFDENGFALKIQSVDLGREPDDLDIMFGLNVAVRMVRSAT